MTEHAVGHRPIAADAALSSRAVAGAHGTALTQLAATLDDGATTQRLHATAGLLNPASQAPVRSVDLAMPRPAGAAVAQLFRYVLGRDAVSHREKKERAVRVQNQLLAGITTLYVGGDTPTLAYPVPNLVDNEEVTIERGTSYPRDDTFADKLNVKFAGAFYNYKVGLITHPDAEPDWSAADDVIDGMVNARVAPPYPILQMTLRGGGSGMGRPVGGAQFWSVNPDFGGVVGGDQAFKTRGEIVAWGVGELLLPLDSFVEHAPGDMMELPAPRDQPFVFYIDPRTPRIDQPETGREAISVAEFERRFEREEQAGGAVARQSGISTAPHTSRKDGGSERDPATAMGGLSASSVVGGRPPPMPGALASHEWCHLIGDGDSGKCAPENLVVGTNSVNTEQLAMENSLRPSRARIHQFGLAIQITARAQCTTIDHGGQQYLVAQYILYEIDLVNPAMRGPLMGIFRHVMHGGRGAISALEYDMLGAIVEERLNRAVVTFLRDGVPPELGGPPRQRQAMPSARRRKGWKCPTLATPRLRHCCRLRPRTAAMAACSDQDDIGPAQTADGRPVMAREQAPPARAA